MLMTVVPALLLGQIGPTEIYYDLKLLQPVSRPALAKASETYLLRELGKKPLDVDLQAAARTRYLRLPNQRFYEAIVALLKPRLGNMKSEGQQRAALHLSAWEYWRKFAAMSRSEKLTDVLHSAEAPSYIPRNSADFLETSMTREEAYLYTGMSVSYPSSTLFLRGYLPMLLKKWPGDPVLAAYGTAVAGAAARGESGGKPIPGLNYSPDPAHVKYFRQIVAKAPPTAGFAFSLATSARDPERRPLLQKYLTEYPNDWPRRRLLAKFLYDPRPYVNTPAAKTRH